MHPPLLILAPRVTDDSVAIWQAALSLGWSTRRLANWRVPDDLRNQQREIVVYAEPLFAEAVAGPLGLTLLETPPNWLTTLPRSFIHRDVTIVPLSEARRLTRPTFVKPAEGKVFEPRVYANGEELPLVEQIGDLPVLLSTPVRFRTEIRCFVVDRRVVTCSPYWRDNALARRPDGTWPFVGDERAQARAFAEALLSDQTIAVPPAFVLDVGLTEEHGWAVIEANPCWGAGLYGCDPVSVLQAIRHAVRSPEFIQGRLKAEERTFTSGETGFQRSPSIQPSN